MQPRIEQHTNRFQTSHEVTRCHPFDLFFLIVRVKIDIAEHEQEQPVNACQKDRVRNRSDCFLICHDKDAIGYNGNNDCNKKCKYAFTDPILFFPDHTGECYHQKCQHKQDSQINHLWHRLYFLIFYSRYRGS